MEQSKLRKFNIVWTVSQDYSFSPIINLFDSYEDFDMDYYKMAVLGSVYKNINMDELLNFLYKSLNKTELKNEFLKLVEIYLDDCLFKDLLRERPGLKTYRDRFLKKIEAGYKDDFTKYLHKKMIQRKI